MNAPRISVIDDIIRNWFPIVGILFLVAGMSYLFYEGIWQNLNEVGRLTLGFLSGVLLISGSYPLEKSSKIVSDSLLAGGLLMLYVSLIFGSRFDATEHRAIIPEVWALIIATLFYSRRLFLFVYPTFQLCLVDWHTRRLSHAFFHRPDRSIQRIYQGRRRLSVRFAIYRIPNLFPRHQCRNPADRQ